MRVRQVCASHEQPRDPVAERPWEFEFPPRTAVSNWIARRRHAGFHRRQTSAGRAASGASEDSIVSDTEERIQSHVRYAALRSQTG